MNSSSTQRSAL